MSLSVKEIITLNTLFGVGSKHIYPIAFQPCNAPILERIRQNNIPFKIDGKRTSITAQHILEAEQTADRIITDSIQSKIGLLSFFDDNYPDKLRRTIDEKGNATPPLLLYYKGDLSLLHMPCATIVGTRQPSVAGVKASSYLSQQLARQGFCIVSGLALGCDTAAHKSALNENGKTIAILAHGLDIITPYSNKALAHEIVTKGGLLLSEYPIHTSFSKYSFISRDRLQASLSNLCIVVQTGINGGCMHVSNATLLSHKPLYTVYFKDEATRNLDITAGNDYLVKKGATYLTGNDNLDELFLRFKN